MKSTQNDTFHTKFNQIYQQELTTLKVIVTTSHNNNAKPYNHETKSIFASFALIIAVHIHLCICSAK